MGVAAVMLAVPGTAFATAFFKGPVGTGANNAGVEFRAKFKHGEPKKALEFRWFNVPIPPNCTDFISNKHFEMRVNRKRKFHGTFSVPNTDHKATVRGKFNRHEDKASGTIELKGDFGVCSNVDTGPLAWTAKRAGT